MPCKRVSLSLGGPLGNLEGICLLGLIEKKKDSISGFLSWTQRNEDLTSGGHLELWEKGQGSPELILDYGAQRAIRSRCIGTIRA
jgi:hypothetical protein